jgi:hypothetical protein
MTRPRRQPKAELDALRERRLEQKRLQLEHAAQERERYVDRMRAMRPLRYEPEKVAAKAERLRLRAERVAAFRKAS